MLDDSDVKFTDSQVHYLRMNHRIQYGRDKHYDLQMQLLQKPVDPRYYLELYQGVGLGFDWVDRLVVSEAKLSQLINRAEVDIFIFLCDDYPCGYVEFFKGVDYVELLYFGLFPEYSGRGLGVPCLKMAVEQAWSYEPEWIELNTCDLDSEHAMSIYTKVGFEEYTTRVERRRTFF